MKNKVNSGLLIATWSILCMVLVLVVLPAIYDPNTRRDGFITLGAWLLACILPLYQTYRYNNPR